MRTTLPQETEVAVIGAGQAGLSMSWHLQQRGVAHVVIERGVPAQSWREERWDSFHLVTPNWQCRLPGHPYGGGAPGGFLDREGVASYIEAYASSFGPPLVTEVEVTGLRPRDGGFELETGGGAVRARRVVVATGGYHVPRIPEAAAGLPAGIAQLHAGSYRRPDALPAGAVLVVGSGLSGAQIAEELFAAGRDVHLACGSAPRQARRYRGRDVAEWLELSGAYDVPVERHALGPAVRDVAAHVVSGLDGGRDIDLRRHARAGMRLHGRLQGIEGAVVRFADDLRASLDAADAAEAAIRAAIDRFVAAEGIDAPPAPPPEGACWTPPADAPLRLDLEAARVGTVVWCTGMAAAFGWIDAPVFDARGRPVHRRGVTAEAGLFFLGLPWLHSWGSGRLAGVGRDAAFLADRIVDEIGRSSR